MLTLKPVTDVHELFRHQRAIRSFTDRDVPDELVRRVLTAAIHGRTPASGQAGFQTGASIYPSVQNLMLAARALGLGTVLTTLHRRRKARIHEILGIPDNVESAAIIPLGWPDREYGPNRRPPLEQFVMRDRWNG